MPAAPRPGCRSHARAGDDEWMAAHAAVARGDERRAGLAPGREHALDRGRREVGAVGEDDHGRLDVVRRAPRARSGARRPGPRSQSGQCDGAVRAGCAPATTTTWSTAGRAARGRRAGAGAASARRTASPHRRRGRRPRSGLFDRDLLDHDRLRRRPVAGAELASIARTVSMPLGHLADDRVLRRQARVGAGDDEELAAGRARRLGRRLSPSRRRPACTRRPAAARRRSCSRGRPCRCRSGRRPGSRSRERPGGRSCRRRSRSFASETSDATVFGAVFWSSSIVKPQSSRRL